MRGQHPHYFANRNMILNAIRQLAKQAHLTIIDGDDETPDIAGATQVLTTVADLRTLLGIRKPRPKK